MSYVIQNFYKPTHFLVVNERFKLLLRFSNLIKLFTFFKFFFFSYYIPQKTRYEPTHLRKAFAESFNTNTIFFEALFTIKSRPHLTSKFHKTLRFHSLKILLGLFTKKKIAYNPILKQGFLVNNVYFLPITINFYPSKKKMYKPLFLYFLLMVSIHWPTVIPSYCYSNVFFYTALNFKLIYFENTRIFKTHQL